MKRSGIRGLRPNRISAARKAAANLFCPAGHLHAIALLESPPARFPWMSAVYTFPSRESDRFPARIGNSMRKYPLILSLAFLVAVVPFCFAQAAQTAPPKRPMTFEDMMKMKRLGETAVSPDGKWLAYSVTTVNLEQNTKTAELWLQAISGGEPQTGRGPARRQRPAVQRRRALRALPFRSREWPAGLAGGL
jgi:hypothetical protein